MISVVVPDAASAKGLAQRLARVFDPASISLDADRSEVRVEEKRTPSQAIPDTLGLIQDWLAQTQVGSVVVRLDENSYILERPAQIASRQ
jgi:hypothetical protein